MAKKKTRKQKILADSRHIVYHLENETSARVSQPREKKEKQEVFSIPRSGQTIALSSYSHVTTDIKKTALITGAILLTQIVLFIVINSM